METLPVGGWSGGGWVGGDLVLGGLLDTVLPTKKSRQEVWGGDVELPTSSQGSVGGG